jgi:hypothetical protein
VERVTESNPHYQLGKPIRLSAANRGYQPLLSEAAGERRSASPLRALPSIECDRADRSPRSKAGHGEGGAVNPEGGRLHDANPIEAQMFSRPVESSRHPRSVGGPASAPTVETRNRAGAAWSAGDEGGRPATAGPSPACSASNNCAPSRLMAFTHVIGLAVGSVPELVFCAPGQHTVRRYCARRLGAVRASAVPRSPGPSRCGQWPPAMRNNCGDSLAGPGGPPLANS